MLLDDLAGRFPAEQRETSRHVPMDLPLLSRLETGLAQADLTRFARSRPVMSLRTARDGAPPAVAWEERYFAVDDLSASLCPEREIRNDPWLFRRLTRTLDLRMLAVLGSARGQFCRGPFALNMHVATLLSPEFLRFDEGLPLTARGRVTLMLKAADILADAATFAFARNFTHARHNRLALCSETPALFGFLNAAAAGFDHVIVPLGQALKEAPATLQSVSGSGVDVVLSALDRPSDVRWAIDHGFKFGCGKGFNP